MNRSTKVRLAIILVVISLAGATLACQLATPFLPQVENTIVVDNGDAPHSDTVIEPTEELPPGHPAVEARAPVTIPAGELDGLFAPFWEAWDIVHDQFVDQPVDDEALMNGAIQGMLGVFELANLTTYEALPVPSGDDTGTPEELEELFVPFWETWAFTHRPDDQALMQGAISGMLDALGDQHTSYMDPDQFTQANIPLDGTYEGIGAWVDPNRDYLTIVSPMSGSPAEEAGMLPGDEIVAVDGDDMTGIDGNLVIRRVLGPAGSKVILTVRRQGVEEPFDVEITRATITIPSVEYRMMDNDIAYVQLFNFGNETHQDLRDALEEVLDQDPVGLIFDLRNNGGGFLNTAIDVSSEFIDEGVILYEEYGDGRRDTYSANGNGLATDIPLVVLINEGTASASEIVSGAIQDYDRALLVGTTSFGKGSVQNWIPLSNNQGAVRITIARWLTPDERQIHEVGLEPDYPLAVISQAAIDDGFDPESFGLPMAQVVILSDEDIQEGRDPQLDKAVEVLLELIEQ
ncbi:MAG: S41 family peptidase [Anaerolineales bacterium]|nr:S41 family peptidase [Anaerolineales bacterium]